MKNTLTKMKNTLEETKSRIIEAERISEEEDKLVEITETEQDRETRMKRNEESLRDDCNIIKHTNIWIIEVPEEEDK